MVLSKGNLKVLSICHLVAAAIFFGLGMADRFEVRYVYSFVAIPCWTSALIIITGILGLVAGCQRRPPSPTMSNAIWSLSAGCVVLSILVMYIYVITLATLVNLYGRHQLLIDIPEESAPRYTDKQKKHLAITSLILIVSVVEMLIAFGTAKSCHGVQAENYQYLQENGSVASYPSGGQMPVLMNQQPHVTMMPVVAMPTSGVNQ